MIFLYVAISGYNIQCSRPKAYECPDAYNFAKMEGFT